MRFRDRVDAGRQLAARLSGLALSESAANMLVAVAMPRGGVPVAAEVARALDIPLDVVLVRKLGVPSHREFAMGAIGEDGVRFVDEDTVTALHVSPEEVATVEQMERLELERRSAKYRQGAPRISLEGKTVVVIDDGIATGATARVACRVVRAHGARRIVLAVPIAPPGWKETLHGEADEFVAVAEQNFSAVGDLYESFDATSDAEVVRCLLASGRRTVGPDSGDISKGGGRHS